MLDVGRWESQRGMQDVGSGMRSLAWLRLQDTRSVCRFAGHACPLAMLAALAGGCGASVGAWERGTGRRE
jgi:hypothetical protein